MLTFLMAGGFVTAAVALLGPIYVAVAPYPKNPPLKLSSAAADRLMWRAAWLTAAAAVVAVGAAVAAHVG